MTNDRDHFANVLMDGGSSLSDVSTPPVALAESITPPLAACATACGATVVASGIARGVQRALRDVGFASVSEVVLANGRRADVLAINDRGAIWIVEIKSSVADFRADHKWPEYRAYCDALYFAVAPTFPTEILPADTGLILADDYGGEILRPAPLHPLGAARRKSVTLSVAMLSALRLQAVKDPQQRIV